MFCVRLRTPALVGALRARSVGQRELSPGRELSETDVHPGWLSEESLQLRSVCPGSCGAPVQNTESPRSSVADLRRFPPILYESASLSGTVPDSIEGPLLETVHSPAGTSHRDSSTHRRHFEVFPVGNHLWIATCPAANVVVIPESRLTDLDRPTKKLLQDRSEATACGFLTSPDVEGRSITAGSMSTKYS